MTWTSSSSFYTIAGLAIAGAVYHLTQSHPAQGEDKVLTMRASIILAFLTPALLSAISTLSGEHAFIPGPLVAAILAPILVHYSYRPGLAAVINPLTFIGITVLASFFVWGVLENHRLITAYDAAGFYLFCLIGSVANLLFGLMGLIGAKRNQANKPWHYLLR